MLMESDLLLSLWERGPDDAATTEVHLLISGLDEAHADR